MISRRMLMLLLLTLLCCLGFAVQGLADVRVVHLQNKEKLPVELVVDTDYVRGKVNDPISRKSMSAYIVKENPVFHVEAADPSVNFKSTKLLVYMNQYLKDVDQGARIRMVMKELPMGSQSAMLPDDVYESQMAEGAAYDFVNRCYVIRVYQDEAQKEYKDFYFGIVDSLTFERMQASQQGGGAEAA